jgi:hypothetical protein
LRKWYIEYEGVATMDGLHQNMWNMDEPTPTSLKNLTKVGQWMMMTKEVRGSTR